MVKLIRIICIAGILALLVLFVLFTGAGRSSSKKGLNDNSFKHQTNKASRKDKKSIEANSQKESETLNMIIPW